MIRDDNRGLSLVELVIVIAIIAVMIAGAVIGVSLLFGTEARQAAAKTESQLNNVKTEAMSRYSEYMVVRYIDETDPTKGVDSPGYYAVKTAYTIDNTSDLKRILQGSEYTRIGSKKVDIEVNGSDVLESDGTNYLKIEFDRATGKLINCEMDSVASPGDVDGGSLGGTEITLQKIEFKSGLKTYTITFDKFGKHKLTTS